MIFKKKIGLVLGGGGARGFFHMGVIKAIQELNIIIDEIAGTSIGAIIGVIYASNPKIDFEKMANELDFLEIFKILALVKNKDLNKNIEEFLKKYVGVENFSDLKIRCRFNATDINQRKEIVFDSGKIFPALIGSISIPGVFKPLKYEENYLIDGGVSNNIPITLIDKAKKILVSDITGPIKKIDEKTLATDVLYSSIAVMQQKISLEKAKDTKKEIIYLNLDDDKTFILDFRKKNYQYLIDMGYESVMKVKNKL
ncbi:hypothetical protein SDC9_82701 [bioreactor metagenome]|uniref:PNPLA domain-containing protein n=1 Tax=bioreactor metagenome TaxID=1076179 RepID=A0A644Z5G8_9ZZZZ